MLAWAASPFGITDDMDLEPPDLGRLRLAFRHDSHGASARALGRACQKGELERLRPGVMRPPPPPLATLEPSQRYRESRLRFLDLVNAVGLTRRTGPVVFSHRTAAAVLDLPSVGGWPPAVDLLVPRGAAWRNRRGIRVHEIGYRDDEVLPWGPFFVTTAARTLADLARAQDFAAAVIAFDAALNAAARPTLRVTKSDVSEILARHGDWGLARAHSVLDFADGRAANAGESASRIVIHQLGYGEPQLQVRHFHAGGFFDVDFEWPADERRPRPLIGEFDGAGKYLKPEYLGAMTPGEAVVKEKRREDILRRQNNDFARWGWQETRRPSELDQILRECGLRPVRRRLV
jgi:hypothetical protein